MYKTIFCIIVILINASICTGFNFDNQLVTNNGQKKNSIFIPFSFERKKLVDIINLLAEKKQVNVLFPQNPNELEVLNNQTVTYQPHFDTTITLKKAWQLLIVFLEMSGYSLFLKAPNLYEINKIGKQGEVNISQNPLPLYMATDIKDLPQSEERIRYIYYLNNLKVPAQEGENPLTTIIKDMSSDGVPNPIYLTKQNGFMLTDKANVISSIITIISELDHSGFRETIEVLPLNYIPAKEVATIFDTIKKAAGQEAASPFIRESHKVGAISYFATDTKIIPDPRNNSLIIMGRENAVNRIRDFIQEYLDILPETGKSILHYYDLQYLDAQEFAPILQNIVSAQKSKEQAAQAQGTTSTFFNGVVVMAEQLVERQPIPGQGINFKRLPSKSSSSDVLPLGIKEKYYTGGNRLIIAAIETDWLQIKDLIKKLDIQQPQVIMEVVVADIARSHESQINGTTRSKTQLQLLKGFQFLSSNISPVNNVLGPAPGLSPVQLAEDLLQLVLSPTGPTPVQNLVSPGSLLISFNDVATPGIWTLLQILDQYANVRIRSHPFLATLHNKSATVASQLTKRTQGDAYPDKNGSFVIPVEKVSSVFNLSILPKIASKDSLKIDFGVEVADFIGSTLNRTNRRIRTTAVMKTNQVLVIGGLHQTRLDSTITKTPIIGDIPLIGFLFSGYNYTTVETNIVIFAQPTIIMPKAPNKQEIITDYTSEKLQIANDSVRDTALFGQDNRDPIVHLFFKQDNGIELIDEYIDQTINLSPSKSFILPSQQQVEEINFEPQENKLKEKLSGEKNPLLSKSKKLKGQNIVNTK